MKLRLHVIANRYDSTPYASATVLNQFEWVEFDITDLYNEWKTGTPNYGVMLNTVGSGSCVGSQPTGDCQAGVFYTSDHTEMEFRPQLVVNLQQCTDADFDGYYAESGCGTEVDCDDTDGDIHPGAAEIPGDNIDQDCDGSDSVNIQPGTYYVDPVNGTDNASNGDRIGRFRPGKHCTTPS